jgi:hypothetical protein
MKSLLAQVVAILLATSLSGCDLDVPSAASATCTTFAAGSPGPTTELTSTQLHALNTWLGGHRAGWSGTFATNVPRTLLLIRDGDGQASSLNFSPGQLVASGRYGQYRHALSKDETRALTEILDSP